jgi:hypothetical protein
MAGTLAGTHIQHPVAPTIHNYPPRPEYVIRTSQSPSLVNSARGTAIAPHRRIFCSRAEFWSRVTADDARNSPTAYGWLLEVLPWRRMEGLTVV